MATELTQKRRTCLICGAVLARDNPDPVCTCHDRADYRLRHDGETRSRALEALLVAYPQPCDLGAALRTADVDGLNLVVRGLRRRGFPIASVAPRTYRLAPPPVAGDAKRRRRRSSTRDLRLNRVARGASESATFFSGTTAREG